MCIRDSHYPGHYGPGWRYFQEPTPDERRAYLEEEKKALERRLKDVEARIAEMSR